MSESLPRRLLFWLLAVLLVVMPYGTFLSADTRYQILQHGHVVSDGLVKLLFGWKELLLAIGLLLVVLTGLAERRLPIVLLKADAYVLAFVLVGTLFGYLPTHSLKDVVFGFRYDFSVFAFYLLGRTAVLTRDRLLLLCKVLVISSLPIFAFGLLQTVRAVPPDFLTHYGYGWVNFSTGNPLPPYHLVGSHTVRAMGTFPGPNSLAMYAVAMLLLVLLFGRRWWGSFLTWLVGGLIAVTLVCTFSRGHLVSLVAALLLGLLLWLARYRLGQRTVNGRLAVIGVYVVLFLVLAFASPFWLDSLSKSGGLLTVLTHGDSTAGHHDVLVEALHRFAAHPWGSGLGTAGLATTNTGGTVFNPESWYAQLLVEFGWWGIPLALAVVIRLYRQLLAMLDDMADPEDHDLTMFFLLELTAIVFSASFLPSWFEVTSIMFWVLFGGFVADYFRSFPKGSEVLSIQPRA